MAVGDPTSIGEEKLDEQALQSIASITGGRYFYGQDRAELETIYRELDEIGTHEIETITHRPKRDLFHWPLGGFLFIGFLWHAVEAIRGKR